MPEAQAELWLIRHGETEWSLSGQHTGRTDLHLTTEGRHRAEAVGRHLAGRPFALVLCSPLARAAETCRLAGYGSVGEFTDDLLEWDFGEYEGRLTADIRKERPGWTVWDGGAPRGETAEQVADRARRIIDRVDVAGGDVALFAHAKVLQVLTACWLGLPPDAGRLFVIGTASLSVLAYADDIRVVKSWNQDSHLVHEDER